MARWTIIEGPSKFDLMTALFVGGGYYGQLKLAFQLEGIESKERTKKYFVINGLTRNSFDSKLSWLFTGYWTGEQQSGNERRNWQNAHGEYSDKTRKGWVEISH
ncbi:MAG TPA: hypothetical protein VLE93_01180 [Candidatus Saccharimonadales bacterium]|nr:hypothetical protein [Candidatus Saccharimonadales bacterium]